MCVEAGPRPPHAALASPRRVIDRQLAEAVSVALGDDCSGVMTSQSEEGAEVRVERDEHTPVIGGESEDRLIRAAGEAEWDDVRRIVTCPRKTVRDARLQRLVDQGPHAVSGTMRSSRFAAAKRSASRMSSATSCG